MAEGTKLGSAHVELRADQDKLKSDLASAQTSVSSAMGSVAKIAAGAGLAIGAAFIGAGVAAFKLGETFDGAYDTIRAGTGATGDALDALKADFKAVVSDVPADFGVASEVIAELNKRTGATGTTLQDLSKNMLEFSRITGTDAVTNVGLATRVFGDWSIATEDQAGTLDKVFRASQATGIGVQELMGKVVQFGAPLRAMGFSLDESAAMLGKWEKEGVNTELVLGSMRIAMSKFADAGIPAREGLDATIKSIQALGPSAEATSLAMDTFGARAGPDMAAAILEGRFELGALFEQISNGGETVMGAAADTADGAERMKLAMNRVQVAMEPVGTAVFNLGGTLVQKLAPAIENLAVVLAPTIAAFAEGLGPALDTTIAVAGTLFETFTRDVLPVLTEMARVATEVLTPVVKSMTTDFETWAIVIVSVLVPAFIAWGIAAAAAAVSTAIALAPVVIPIVAIGLAIAALAIMWKDDWGGIQTKTQAVWHFLEGAFTAIRGGILLFVNETLPSLVNMWTTTWDRIDGACTEGMRTLSIAFRNAGPALLGLLRAGLDAAWGSVIANVTGGLGRVAALLPHSLAEEGPLSVPTSWQDVLIGDLVEVAAATVETIEATVEEIDQDWTSLRDIMRQRRLEMQETLADVAEDFAETAAAAASAAESIGAAASGGGGGGGGPSDFSNAVSGSQLAGAMASYSNQTNAALLNSGTVSSGIGAGGVGSGITGAQSVTIALDGVKLGKAIVPYVRPESVHFAGSRIGGV